MSLVLNSVRELDLHLNALVSVIRLDSRNPPIFPSFYPPLNQSSRQSSRPLKPGPVSLNPLSTTALSSFQPAYSPQGDPRRAKNLITDCFFLAKLDSRACFLPASIYQPLTRFVAR
ncbi:hypothetical protein PGTUg99_005015 [Puccinia graminis f. sp. tritici]|uniref:Uncharacterized protein n=1 Tax=Puccinia graminis f. sp. tritici TaxID=56615 RepID=A0A5B0SK23_PUCGR|nr:hypothetical protein PGTUg99_005015 [Puccinia graminis f. sp. tritici]